MVLLILCVFTATIMSKRRKCILNNDLAKEFPFIKKLKFDSDVRCDKCLASFSIANGGKADIVQHLKTEKHKKSDIAASSSKLMSDFLRSKIFDEATTKNAIIEGTWAYHTIQHNHSFRSNDCTSKLIKNCFDEKYSCARSKCEAIVCNVLAPHSIDNIKIEMSTVNFVTLYSDCSNHGNIKICPILARFFTPTNGIQVKILECMQLPGEKSDIISKYIQDTMETYNIKDKLLAICADNTNCNFGGAARGGRNNVFYKIQAANSNILLGVNCAAHVLNNCIQTAAECLPIDIEVIVVKIYSYFYIYTVRVEQFKEICDNVDVDYRKLLGHSKTRWLTLKPAIERVLKLFKALKEYFLSQEKCPTVLQQFFNDPCSEAWLFFAHSQATIFHRSILQIESQKISMTEVSKIIKDVKNKAQERKDASYLPLIMRKMLNDLEKSGHINIAEFKTVINCFYDACIQYIDQWDAAFVEVENLEWTLLCEVPVWSKVEASLSFILEKRKDLKFDENELFDEFCCVKNYADLQKIKEWTKDETTCEQKWLEIFAQFQVKNISFLNILKIVEFSMCLPASNAPSERVFSLMNDMWTSEKTQMMVETIKAMLITKCNFSMTCAEFKEYIKENKDILKKIHNSEKYQK